MSNLCRKNRFIYPGATILIQTCFLFIFLTIFFFIYVVKVEQGEFEDQINLTMDTLMDEISDDFNKITRGKNPLETTDSAVLVSGLIDQIENKITKASESGIKSVIEQNKNTKRFSLISLGIVIGFVVICITVLYLFGFCIPIVPNFKEGILIIIFVGITEIAFLHIIAKRYISASPSKVKQSFGQAIQKWIEKNHPNDHDTTKI